MTTEIMSYSEIADLVANTMGAVGFTVTADRCFGGTAAWANFCEMMRYEGFTFCGNGFFSAVFKHEEHEGKVFKFGFKKEDSGAAYAAWCRAEWEAGRGCPAIPKVHHLMRNSKFYMVVLDELRPVNQVFPNICDEDGDVCYRNYNLPMMNGMESAMVGYYETYPDYLENINDYVNMGADDNFGKSMANSELYLVLKRIGKHFQGVTTFDLHCDNFMYDHNGCIVITDPVSFSAEYDNEEEY
ncbi:MAG: hypothetical protein ACRDCE_20195 [Cetobacterium sp.]|uniref:hypothetical protein n=1 Tax=Cetobacterium sp. TaxID=2071632 RepID=UPI003EE60C69